MNKIKKILILVTCFCFSFVFLFSITFARPNTVKAEYNLWDHKYFYDTLTAVNPYNISFETKDDRTCIKIINPNSYNQQGIELYKGHFAPNTQYVFNFELMYVSDSTYPGFMLAICYTDGTTGEIYGSDWTTGIWFEVAVVSDANKTIDYIGTTYGDIPPSSYFNVDSMTLSYFDENLGFAYEQGYNNGMTKRDARTWTAVLDINPLQTPDMLFRPDGNIASPEYQTLPFVNGINPFGRVTMLLPPATYRLSFINKTSGFYPLMYDFQGFIYDGVSFNLVTPLCRRVPMGDYRPQSPSFDVFNLSNSPYSFADAHSCEPIVFTVPLSIKPSGSDYVEVVLYMMTLDSSFNFINWDNFTTPPFFDLCAIDFLEPTSSYNQGYADGYDLGTRDGSIEGHNAGYIEGYDSGYNTGLSGTISTNWFTSFLSSTFNILNIEIFPNIKLIYLVFIPIGLGVLALILKMARG